MDVRLPMYDGPVPVSAGGMQPMLPNDVGAEARVQGWQRVAAGLDRLGQVAVQLDDERRLMDGEAKLTAIRLASAKKLDDKLHIPDGDEGSLFDKEGVLRVSEVEKFQREIDKEYETVGRGMLTADGMSAMERAKVSARERMLADLQETAEKEARARLEFSFDNNFDAAVKAGEFGRAGEIAVRAGKVGAWTALKSRKMHAKVLARSAVNYASKRIAPQLNAAPRRRVGGGGNSGGTAGNTGKRRFGNTKFN